MIDKSIRRCRIHRFSEQTVQIRNCLVPKTAYEASVIYCLLSWDTDANGAMGLSMNDPKPMVTFEVKLRILFAREVPSVATFGCRQKTSKSNI